MKNEILDDIFKDKLRNELEEGEVVFWDGTPRVNKYSRLKSIFYFGIMFTFYYLDFNWGKGNPTWLNILYLILFTSIIFGFFFSIFSQKKTRYIITNFRIIFQLQKGWKKKTHSLTLNQIENITYKSDGEKDGTIFIEMKKHYKPSFKTENLKYRTQREIPTLEMIESVEEVVGIIQNGIQGKL